MSSMPTKKKKIPATQLIGRTPKKVYTCPVRFADIKTRRRDLGLTQTQAARLAGWPTQQQWANVENGKRPNPRIDTLAKVARVLRCKVADLLNV